MTPAEYQYHLSTGWVAYLHPGEMRLISPTGRSWRVELEAGSEERLVQILEGRRPTGTPSEVELLRRLEELDAVIRVVPEGPTPDGICEVLIQPGTPATIVELIKATGLEPKGPEDELTGDPAVVLSDGLLSEFVLSVNKRVLTDPLRLLLVIVQGSAISVGPLIDPNSGGPCLRCLYERATASLLAAIRWAGSRESAIVRLGSAPASEEGVHLAMLMARRTLADIRDGTPAGRLLSEMRRVLLDEGRTEMLACHPLPRCPECGDDAIGERPMVDYRDIEGSEP